MRMYALTYNKNGETQKVSVAAAFNKLANEMHTAIAEDCKVSEVNDGFNEQGWVVEKASATNLCRGINYTIKEIDAEPREFIIAYLVEEIMAIYGIPYSRENILANLLDEVKFNDLCKGFEDTTTFVDDILIGEVLYERALAELGGKTDDKSYEIIHKYLNEGFVNKECSNLDDFDSDYFGGKTAHPCQDEWINGMLLICEGNEAILSSVRNNIDKDLQVGEKVFTKERIDEWAEKYGLPKNHKELSSRLNEKVYYSVMDYILNYSYRNGFENNFYRRMVNNYEEMYYTLFSVIRHKGFDVVLEEYGEIFEVRENPQKEGEWYVCFVGDPYEIASAMDEMRDQYLELF